MQGSKRYRYNMLNLTIVLFMSLLCACGSKFETIDSREANSDLETILGSHLPAQEILDNYLISINAQEAPATGENAPKLLSADAEPVNFQRILHFKFSDISNLFYEGEISLKKNLWNIDDCSDVGTGKDHRDPKKQYRCGEVPFGTITSNTSKNIFDFNFDGLSGSYSGINYSADSASIPIYLQRSQVSSRSNSISILDNKSRSSIVVNNKLGDTIYYKVRPQNGNLLLNVCFFAPGLRINSQPGHIHVNAYKKIWFFKLSADVDINVKPASISFQRAEFCSNFNVYLRSNGLPKFEFVAIETPKFSNLSYSGLSVNANVNASGILGFIFNFSKLIGLNIEKKLESIIESKIADKADRLVQEITDQDIKSGKWLSKYISKKVFSGKVVNDLELAMRSKIETLGPASDLNLTSQIQSACEVLAEDMQGPSADEFLQICSGGFEVQGQLFLEDNDSSIQGCYSHYFSASKVASSSSSRWWYQGCKIRNNIQITAPPELVPVYTCIAKYINQGKESLLNDASCAQELALMDALYAQDPAKYQNILEEARDIYKTRIQNSDLQALVRTQVQDYFH